MRNRIFSALLGGVMVLTSCAGPRYQSPETVRWDSPTSSSVSDEGQERQESEIDAAEMVVEDQTPGRESVKNNFVVGEIYNNGEVSITAEKIEYGWTTTDFSFVFDNSTDEEISVLVDAFSINGLMASAFVYTPAIDLSSNSKTRATLSVETASLEAAGIENISSFDIAFTAYQVEPLEEKWATDVLSVPMEVDIPLNELNFEIVYQDEYTTVYVSERTKKAVTYIIKNHSGGTIEYLPVDCNIDGWTYDISHFSMYWILDRDIFDNGYVMSTITIDESFLADSGIESPTQMSLKFKLEGKSKDAFTNGGDYTTDTIDIELE